MASINMGTLYAYATNNNHGRYSCEFQYDSITRNGNTVTLNNARVVMTRYNTGYTTNRIAGCCYFGDTNNYISWNVTLNNWGSNSPATITYSLGSPSYNTTSSSIIIGVYVASTGKSYDWDNFIGNSPLVLSTYLSCPPAYVDITTFYVSKISGADGITKVQVTWGASDSCDYIWYSTDNGASWHGASGYPTFIISGLSPNTGYNFKIRVRRTSSQLTTDSGTYWQSTYDYNKISSGTPNISNGSALSVSASNPSGATCKIRLETLNPTVSRFTIDGTSGSFSVEQINSLMALYPNTPSFPIRVVADTYVGNNVAYNHWVDGTFSIINSNPVFTSFDYQDVNTITQNLTNSNGLIIVKGYSNVKVNNVVANAINGATLSYVNVKGNLVPYSDTFEATVDNYTENNIKLYVVDSRGNSKDLTKAFVDGLGNSLFKEYFKPTNNGNSYVRYNHVGEQVTISLNGTFWNNYFDINSTNINTISAIYRYKKTQDSEWITGITPINLTIENNNFSFEGIVRGDTNLGFEIDESYDLEVIVTDLLDSVTFTYLIGAGNPALIIEGNKIMKANNIFPIGFIYFSDTNINPSTYYSGTWVSVSSSVSQYAWKRTA